MTSSSNTSNLSSESTENTQRTTSTPDSLANLFVQSKLEDKKQRYAFLNRIEKDDTLSDSTKEEMREFAENKPHLLGVDVESVKISSIREAIGGYAAGIHSKKASLRKTFLQEYDISGDEYAKKISGKIDEVSSEQELTNLLDSADTRRDFLKKLYGKKKLPNKQLFKNIFLGMDIQKRISGLPEHEQISISSVIQKFYAREKLGVEDAITLFESGIFNLDEKQKIIEAFLPSVSLKDLLDLQIITTSSADNLKKTALAHALGLKNFPANDSNYTSYLSDIGYEDIIVPTDMFFKDASRQDKLFENNLFFEKFTKSINDSIDGIDAKLSANSIQSVDEMKDILRPYDHISGIDSFIPGATIVITQKVKNPDTGKLETTRVFADISKISPTGSFTLLERGVGSYDRRFNKASRQTFSEFIKYATKQSEDGIPPTKIEILSSEELKGAFETGELMDANGEKYFANTTNLNSEIKELTKKIEARKKELRESSDGTYTKKEIENDEKLKRLYALRDAKNSKIENLEADNEKVFIDRLNEFDSNGVKYGAEKGTTFKTRDGDFYTILDVNEKLGHLTLRGLEKNEQITYEQFLYTFEKKGGERISKINSFDEVLVGNKTLDGYELKHGMLHKKGASSKIDFNFLVPPANEKNQELIKIHDIGDDGFATISFGNAKTEKSKSKKPGEKSGDIDVFSIEKQEYRVTLGVLDSYIKKGNLGPRSLNEGKVKEAEENAIPKAETQFNFLSFFLNGMSLQTLLQSGKIGIEQIKSILEEGNEQQANEFALKFFGPLIGQQGRIDMMSRVEQTQKKNMDEMLERLKGINSKPATKLIESWLKDPYCPQYKQDAAVMFMYSKYGALCAKELYKYQGKFFWYQRLGGRIGDEVWQEVHAENSNPKQNVTEELLVYRLIKKQTRTEGFNGVKRRSKLDKELKRARGEGKESEWKVGMEDGSSERDINDRITGGLNEMSSGNYPNAMGWLESVTNKGGTMEEMNKIPFVMMFSGNAYMYEKDLVDKIKNFLGESRMLPLTRFMSYPTDIDLVNETIVEICKKLEAKGGKYKGIQSRAEKIYQNQKDSTMSDLEKQKTAIKFYDDYGEDLTNILYMLNTGDENDTVSKMIFFEKESTPVFKNYYEKLTFFVGSETNFDDELMSDPFAGTGVSGMNMYKVVKDVLELGNEGTWRKHKSGPIMWKEIVHEFEAITKREYSEDAAKNRQMQEKILESNLRQLLSAILASYTSARAQSSFNSPTGYFTKMNEWGIYFDDFIAEGVNAENIKTGGHQALINRFINNIFDVEQKGANYSRKAIKNDSGGYTYLDGESESPKDTISGVGSLIQGDIQQIVTEPKARVEQTPANENIDPNEITDVNEVLRKAA